MSIDIVTEILAAHADQLNMGKPVAAGDFLAAFPNRQDDLVPLLDIASRVKRTLKPVKPEPAFRARLRDGLLMAAHHQQAHQILVEKRAEPRLGWLLGAAALGSAAGLIAVVWHARSQGHKASVAVAQSPSAE
ncbi:MAG: hypothetical protein HY782_19220 [Chloroflexi bacterium]|nr:hypothetical protein [Chloroflexota bacterium]